MAMKNRPIYDVEHKCPEPLGWRPIFGATGGKQFCLGWVAAMDSMYPSRPHRVIETRGSEQRVIRETPGRSKPHLNQA